jgi:hypothetical protein
LTALGAAALRIGGRELATAEAAARELIEQAPFRETGHLLLIETLGARGNQAEALLAYEEVRLLLREELGVSPSAALQAIHARLLIGPPMRPEPRRVEAPARLLALPVESVPASRPALAGRSVELRQLEALHAAANRGTGSLALVTGDPGIGKTRLAAEFAAVAHGAGTNVLWGRCHTEALAPYEPFVEVLRQYAAGCSPEELAALALAAGGEFLALAPELARGIASVEVAPMPEDPQGRRYRLFESIAELLALAARARPLAVVLEDLHWADRSTALLLAHLVRRAPDAGLLMVGTVRDVELEADHPMASLLADRRTVADGSVIELTGLEAQETDQIVGELAPDRGLEQRIHEITEGNPLFVVESLRVLVERGTSERLPLLISDVIDRRLRGLGADALTALGVGAVAGRTFELAVVAQASGLSAPRLVAGIEEAISAHVLEEVPGAWGLVSFAHALIREAGYRQYDAAGRVTLHAAVAAAIRTIHGENLDDHLAELAGHLEAAAGDQLSAREAVDALAAAAGQAAERQAFEAAADLLTRAQALLERAQMPAAARYDLMLGLIADARAAAAVAARLAREEQDGDRLARAALAFVGSQLVFKAGRVDAEDVALLREALDLLSSDAHLLRSRVLTRLCSAIYYSPAFELVPGLSDEAVGLARESGHQEALGWALFSRFWASLRPDGASETTETAEEITRIANRVQSVDLACESIVTGSYALLRRGRPDEVATLIDRRRDAMVGTGIPVYRWFADAMAAMLAVVAGRGEEAERLIAQATTSALAVDAQDGARFGVLPLVRLRFDQGRGGELVEPLRAVVDSNPGLPCWRGPLAQALVARGELEEGQALLTELELDDFAIWPRDVNWLMAMAAAVEACVALGDRRIAGTLYRLLSQLPAQSIIAGPALAYHGPLERYLAPLAALCAPDAEAQELFAVAIEHLDVVGAQPLAAASRRDHARALLAAGDSRGARLRAKEALEAADSLGFAAVAADAAALLDAAAA